MSFRDENSGPDQESPEAETAEEPGRGVSAFGIEWWSGVDRGLFGLNRNSGQVCLLVGLLLVLTARGCDALGNRTVAWADAQLRLAQNQFQDEWEQKRRSLTQQIESAGSVDRRRELREELDALQRDQQRARGELEAGRWQKLESTARDASARNALRSYSRGWWFFLGTLILSLGLITLSFTGEGPERLFALVMIAIITFSIYVGGAAWSGPMLESLAR